MSAPTDKVQSYMPAFHETTEKAMEVKEMKIVTPIGHTKTWVSKMMKTKFPVKLVSGVTLGALFLGVVVGFPFGFGSTGANDPKDSAVSANVSGSSQTNPVEVASPTVEDFPEDAWRADAPYYDDFQAEGESSPTSYEQQRAADSIQDVTDFFGEDVVAALGYGVLAAKLDHYQADGSLKSKDLERLDQEIDVLMMAAAQKSSEARATYNREIDRLEQRITSLLSDARSNPKTNLVSLSREIDPLDDQVETLRQAAMPQQ
jgi:hypothetical protein